jgi:metallo-beta-lactamase class B
MQLKLFFSIYLIIICLQLKAVDPIQLLDKNIGITQLSARAFLLQSSYSLNGQLDCNHLLIVDTKDIVLVNTPATDSLTSIMLDRIAEKFGRPVTKVIVSHFHDDSSGGLAETHKRGITSYCCLKTQELLSPLKRKVDVVFTDSLVVCLQTTRLLLLYPGAGHSVDNMVTWFPDERILFGGCLLKSISSTGKGNIKDADLPNWANTVFRVGKRFSNAQLVIPGHGEPGNSLIFEHTRNIVSLP